MVYSIPVLEVEGSDPDPVLIRIRFNRSGARFWSRNKCTVHNYFGLCALNKLAHHCDIRSNDKTNWGIANCPAIIKVLFLLQTWHRRRADRRGPRTPPTSTWSWPPSGPTLPEPEHQNRFVYPKNWTSAEVRGKSSAPWKIKLYVGVKRVRFEEPFLFLALQIPPILGLFCYLQE